jgi:mannose-6-phosphate isomerase-like protein (cupin superfamily)
MNEQTRSCVIHLADAQAAIPHALGEHAASLLQRGTLNIKLSQPVPPNRQTPHEQDELYIVARGHGVLVHDGKRDEFAAGDLMFIAAGTEHHVEDFSDELTVWVVFFGPQGGELPSHN